MDQAAATERVRTYCALCIARCGAVAVVQDGRLAALEPDPSHPTGQALCAKGRAAPELVHHRDRLTHPLRRTRPKGDPDPGWQRISWNEALDLIAAELRRIAARHGAQAVAISQASPSTTALADCAPWIRRLANAFGTPNVALPLDVCGWGRGFATLYSVAWDQRAGQPVAWDPAAGRFVSEGVEPAVEGRFVIATPQGEISCTTVFTHFAELCSRHTPDAVAKTCWIPAEQVEAAARMIWEGRPSCYYAWSGHEQHSNVTQTARAMSLVHALTGCFDAPGGNVLLPAIPSAPVTGEDLRAAKSMAPTIGLAERPLGTARWNTAGTQDLYRAILDGGPHAVRGLLGFGANLLLAHVGGLTGREALKALEFYAHADLFMSPTAELADVVLPVSTDWLT